MGEYATRKSDGQDVKIGTCEDMYYLRWDQAHLVRANAGSVDPIEYKNELRFRFPFPNEDDVRPGEFEDFERGIAVWGVEPPEGVEHYKVQFVASAGYNVMLPCPEGPGQVEGVSPHRNGFRGAVLITQQRWWNEQLITVCECGGCGAKYRIEETWQADEIAVALRSEADRREHQARIGPHYRPDEDVSHEGRFWHQMADRVLAGYKSSVNV
jgi:hypothetical protein